MTTQVPRAPRDPFFSFPRSPLLADLSPFLTTLPENLVLNEDGTRLGLICYFGLPPSWVVLLLMTFATFPPLFADSPPAPGTGLEKSKH